MSDSSSAPPVTRVALVGAGYIADYHLEAARTFPGVEVTAVCDLGKARADRFASRHGIPDAYGSVEDMLAQGTIDVAHVLTPPNAHVAPAKALLEAGVDVLLEKPLAHTSRDCRELRDLAATHKCHLGTSHNFLYFPAYERLIADVRSGRIGSIDQLDIVWNKPLGQLKGGPFGAWMLQDPRNILFEVAPHCFAHFAHLIGVPDRVVVEPYDLVELPRGLMFFRRWEILAYRAGQCSRIRLSFIDGYPEHYIHIRGSQAAARCDFETNTYVCLDHTPHLLDVDRFLTVATTSKDAVVQAGGTLADFVLTKMGMSHSGGPFQHSILRTVHSFYAGRHGDLDERVSAIIGEQAVTIAEQVAQQVKLPTTTIAAKDSKPSSAGTDTPSIERLPSAAGPAPKILIIGGTGFIGRALVTGLRRRDHAVRLLVRDPSSVPTELRAPGIELARGDFTDLTTVAPALAGIETVYHLARGNGNTWPEFLKYDVEPTKALAQLCVQHEIKRFIYTSSIALYYAGKGAGTITEATAPAPVSDPYGRSKVENEANLTALYRERGLPLVLLRPGVVLGHGGCPLHWGIAGWPYPSVARLWGSGDHKLPIVLVDDCADAMIHAMTTPGIEGQSYNLVGPPLITANEYLDELEQRAGIKLRRIPTSSRTYYAEAMAKWALKKVGRDPHAIRPTYADWEGRSFAATFDGSRAERELDWHPSHDRATVIHEGIHVPTDEWFELTSRGAAS